MRDHTDPVNLSADLHESRLFYNDFAHLVRAPGDPFPKHAERIVKNLKAQGAPITGYGIQGHIGSNIPTPSFIITELDRLGSELDLDLAITEFSPLIEEDDVHADYTRDFITACFASPRVRALTTWGFWEGRHYGRSAAMIRKDWSERPAAKVWHDLFKKQWWTNLQGATGQDGVWKGRGFRGYHQVTVSLTNKATGKQRMHTAQITITGKAEEITVTVP